MTRFMFSLFLLLLMIPLAQNEFQRYQINRRRPTDWFNALLQRSLGHRSRIDKSKIHFRPMISKRSVAENKDPKNTSTKASSLHPALTSNDLTQDSVLDPPLRTFFKPRLSKDAKPPQNHRPVFGTVSKFYKNEKRRPMLQKISLLGGIHNHRDDIINLEGRRNSVKSVPDYLKLQIQKMEEHQLEENGGDKNDFEAKLGKEPVRDARLYAALGEAQQEQLIGLGSDYEDDAELLHEYSNESVVPYSRPWSLILAFVILIESHQFWR